MSGADPRITKLFGCARVLAEELGYDMGVLFMVKFGGQQLSIPKRALRKWSVCRELGREAAEVLCKHYAVTVIDVPVVHMLKVRERRIAIAEHPGSHNQAASTYGVTRRYVKMVRRDFREAQPLPLFEGPSKRS